MPKFGVPEVEHIPCLPNNEPCDKALCPPESVRIHSRSDGITLDREALGRSHSPGPAWWPSDFLLSLRGHSTRSEATRAMLGPRPSAPRTLAFKQSWIKEQALAIQHESWS